MATLKINHANIKKII